VSAALLTGWWRGGSQHNAHSRPRPGTAGGLRFFGAMVRGGRGVCQGRGWLGGDPGGAGCGCGRQSENAGRPGGGTGRGHTARGWSLGRARGPWLRGGQPMAGRGPAGAGGPGPRGSPGWRAATIWRIAAGSATGALIRSRPPQRGQANTSKGGGAVDRGRGLAHPAHSRAQALRMEEDAEARACMQDATPQEHGFRDDPRRGAAPEPAAVARFPGPSTGERESSRPQGGRPPVARRRVSWTRSSWASGRSGGPSPRTAPRNAASSAS
jgi:hypothetical protein